MNSQEPRGIGGWLLIPVGYFLVFLPGLVAILGVVGYLEARPLTSKPVVLLLLLVGGGLLAYYVLLAPWIILLFARHHLFPRVCIVYLVGFMILQVAPSLLFGEASPERLLGVAPLLCFLALWIVYMLRSRRVRNTFTR
jgi:hypothetical protein